MAARIDSARCRRTYDPPPVLRAARPIIWLRATGARRKPPVGVEDRHEVIGQVDALEEIDADEDVVDAEA
jgi:hypothetical protein